MVSSIICTASPLWRGSIVPVQKEKAPDESKSQKCFQDLKKKTSGKLTLMCRHRALICRKCA